MEGDSYSQAGLPRYCHAGFLGKETQLPLDHVGVFVANYVQSSAHEAKEHEGYNIKIVWLSFKTYQLLRRQKQPPLPNNPP